MPSKKEFDNIRARVETMEKIQGEGIDMLAQEIRGLYENDRVIGSAAEQHDTTIAAIRALLVGKGILTNDEIEQKSAEIDEIRTKELLRRKEAEEKERELSRLSEAAEAAGKEGHPKEAFIFGG